MTFGGVQFWIFSQIFVVAFQVGLIYF